MKPTEMFKKKWDLPTLSNYSEPQGENFWSKFPAKPVPVGAQSRVNVANLEKLLKKYETSLTEQKIIRGKKICKDLRKGAEAYQKVYLPSVKTKNSGTAFMHGELMTDKIATWLTDGYVAGPFIKEPFKDFRCNQLIAVNRGGKIRPVVNMSAPAGAAFNDNMIESQLEKVWMTTAKEFSQKLLASGKNSVFSKFDLKDAFKIIPAKPQDWRLQGFSWLGRYFFETRQVFGAVPSVANFDRLGNTIMAITTSMSSIPRYFTSRCLDDVPIVGPANSNWCEEFSQNYSKVCEEINVALAPECPNNDKAFVNKKKGTVLGVVFDSEDLTWCLNEEKIEDAKRAFWPLVGKTSVGLLDMQKALGHVNDLAQLCPIIRF
ncbi:MAG: hypothetical protein FJ333_05650, partial [Sphingomonadales bacterium]|nr:hypothetical protein [Sphingomonadales bacterium]